MQLYKSMCPKVEENLHSMFCFQKLNQNILVPSENDAFCFW